MLQIPHEALFRKQWQREGGHLSLGDALRCAEASTASTHGTLLSARVGVLVVLSAECSCRYGNQLMCVVCCRPHCMHVKSLCCAHELWEEGTRPASHPPQPQHNNETMCLSGSRANLLLLTQSTSCGGWGTACGGWGTACGWWSAACGGWGTTCGWWSAACGGWVVAVHNSSVKAVVGAIFKTRGLCLKIHNFVTISHYKLILQRRTGHVPTLILWERQE